MKGLPTPRILRHHQNLQNGLGFSMLIPFSYPSLYPATYFISKPFNNPSRCAVIPHSNLTRSAFVRRSDLITPVALKPPPISLIVFLTVFFFALLIFSLLLRNN